MKTVLLCLGLVFSIDAVTAFPLPPPLETAHLLGSQAPLGPPPVSTFDELYALGWSRDGKFAVLERRTGVLGPTVLRFLVIDLVADNVLWEQQWPDWRAPEDKEVEWEAHAPDVDRIFARYSLVPSDWQLGEFPLINDNEFYSLALRVTRGEDPLWIRQWEIVLHSTGRGLKSVAKGTGAWRWMTFLGFVPSPWEDRVAGILLVQPAGWAATGQPLRYLIVGLSLKAGFPKP